MPTPPDRYGFDVLAQDPHARGKREVPQFTGDIGMVIECAESGWCGEILRWEKTIEGWAVALEDRHGRTRVFPSRPSAFLIDGQVVTLVRPTSANPAAPRRTASGSTAVTGHRARVARGSRIWVEGQHDAELVEKVWGDDLRIEGVVVEPLHGIDNLVDRAREFLAESSHHLGVLVDHLTAGSKEARIAEAVMACDPTRVLVVGHPFVDIWAAIKPECVGIDAWPTVPRTEDWKTGVCSALGWHDSHAVVWQRLLGQVTRWTDLDVALLGPVEQLIDFVTQDCAESS